MSTLGIYFQLFQINTKIESYEYIFQHERTNHTENTLINVFFLWNMWCPCIWTYTYSNSNRCTLVGVLWSLIRWWDMCVPEVLHVCSRSGTFVFPKWYMCVLEVVHVCSRSGTCVFPRWYMCVPDVVHVCSRSGAICLFPRWYMHECVFPRSRYMSVRSISMRAYEIA